MQDRQELLRDLGLFLLRVAAGAGMLFGHGLSKLSSFSETSADFPDPLGLGSPTSLGLAVFAEVGCAAGVAAGAVTRLAVIPLLVTMAVAFFLVHGGHPWAKRELSMVYGAMYAVILLAGPGRFSLDALFFKKP